MMITQKYVLSQIASYFDDLKTRAQKTVSHKKKFNYSIFQQFSKFYEHFSRVADDSYLTNEQVSKFQYIRDIIIVRYHDLFFHNYIESWADYVLKNDINTALNEIKDITRELRDTTYYLDKEGSAYFQPESKGFINYHIIDLKAIRVSFEQYLLKSSHSEDILNDVQEKINDIEFYINSNQSEIPLKVEIIPVKFSNRIIDYNDMEFDRSRVIGSGASAEVFMGKLNIDNEKVQVAIKVLKYKKLEGNKLHAYQREIANLSASSHSCILDFYGATVKYPFCIVTKWMKNGSLYHALHSKEMIMQPTDLSIAIYDIARGMRFLHANNIVHRDLKSLNVLIDKDYRVKICDFGFSRTISDQYMTMNIGTIHWMAPELLSEEGRSYDTKVDVYSYGILVWEIATKNVPYKGMSQAEIVSMVVRRQHRPKIDDSIPPQLADLIKQCWSQDPAARPSFDEIVQRLRTGTIYLPYTDIKEFKTYIDQVGTENFDQVNKEIESHFNSLGNKNEDFEKFIVLLETKGVTERNLEACFDIIRTRKNKLLLYARGLLVFLKTKFQVEASRLLRKVKPEKDCLNDPQWKNFFDKIIQNIPTGSTEIDENLVVLACRNGYASKALLKCINKMCIRLCMNVIVIKGQCPESDVESVVQFCIEKLRSEQELFCDAMKVLICLGKTKEVGYSLWRELIANRDRQSDRGRLALYCGIAELVLELEDSMYYDIIDNIIGDVDKDPLSKVVLVAAYEKIESYLPTRLKSEELIDEIKRTATRSRLRHQA